MLKLDVAFKRSDCFFWGGAPAYEYRPERAPGRHDPPTTVCRQRERKARAERCAIAQRIVEKQAPRRHAATQR